MTQSAGASTSPWLLALFAATVLVVILIVALSLGRVRRPGSQEVLDRTPPVILAPSRPGDF